MTEDFFVINLNITVIYNDVKPLLRVYLLPEVPKKPM
jgi:hypothetical protein